MNTPYRHGGNRRNFGAQRSFRGPRVQHGRGGGNRRPSGPAIHFSKFINKATITEEAERFVPEHAFADFAIDERIKKNIAHKGYVTPTPIQDKIIPHILKGHDVVGIANTGTGKTGAFLIPLLDKVVKQKDERILIMVPTRELAIQIEEELRGFSFGSGIQSVCAVGGANITPQIRGLQRNPSFVIGTPGRLKDLMARHSLDLRNFKTVVLDEADRMLDMGFINDMRAILSEMSRDRHTLFFSATLSHDIERLIGDFLKNAVRISVKTRDTSKDVDQDIVRVERGANKVDQLAALLANPEFKKVLIFGRTKHGVERLAVSLNKLGFAAESIHGNKTHSKRQRALQLFKSEKIGILVATDVAARGLDIPKVSHVINFDTPASYDDYVHRIGRTGRAGETGKALTFVE